MPARQTRSVSPIKSDYGKTSLSAPRAGSPVRTNHRMSTASTVTTSSQGKKDEANEKKKIEEEEKSEKKKEDEPPYVCAKSPEQPASAAAVLEIAGSLLSQSSTLLQNSSMLQESITCKLKMIHGDKLPNEGEEDKKCEKGMSGSEEKK